MASSNRNYSIKFKSEGLQALVRDLKLAGATFDEVLAKTKSAIAPTIIVNLQPLHSLNAELDKKQKHLKSTRELYAKNPIIPRVDLGPLHELNESLDSATEDKAFRGPERNLLSNVTSGSEDKEASQQSSNHLESRAKFFHQTFASKFEYSLLQSIDKIADAFERKIVRAFDRLADRGKGSSSLGKVADIASIAGLAGLAFVFKEEIKKLFSQAKLSISQNLSPGAKKNSAEETPLARPENPSERGTANTQQGKPSAYTRPEAPSVPEVNKPSRQQVPQKVYSESEKSAIRAEALRTTRVATEALNSPYIEEVKASLPNLFPEMIKDFEELKKLLHNLDPSPDELKRLDKLNRSVKDLLREINFTAKKTVFESPFISSKTPTEKSQAIANEEVARLKALGLNYSTTLKQPKTNKAIQKGITEAAREGDLDLARSYGQHLQQIMVSAARDAENSIKAIAPISKNFDKNQLRQIFAARMQTGKSLDETLQARIKNFRDAVRSGQAELAQSIGESLLADIQRVRRVMNSLARQLSKQTDDPKALQQIQLIQRSYLQQLGRLQGEVLSGSQAKGRASIGLIQLAGSGQIQTAKNDGLNVGKGLAQGIKESEATVKKAGKNLATGAIKSAENELGIASPSKVFQAIGWFVSQGLVQGIKAGASAVKKAASEVTSFGEESLERIRDTIERELIRPSDINLEELIESLAFDGINIAVSGFKQLGNAIGGFYEKIEQQFPVLKKFRGALIGFAATFLAQAGISAIVGFLTNIQKEAFLTATRFEVLKNTIVGASGGLAIGTKNIAFLNQEIKRLSLDLVAATEAYAQLKAASQGTALEGAATDQIFSALGEAAVAKGLDPQQQQRVFLAIQQIMSKGKVSAEELRQQLGEALPGTMQIAARALGVTTQQLDKMLQSGELVATDFLPKFAAQLSAENASGVAGAASSAQASLTRFNNSILEFKKLVGDTSLGANKLGLDILANLINFINKNAELLLKIIGNLSLLITIQLVGAVGKLIVALLGLKNAGVSDWFTLLANIIKGLLPLLQRFLLLTAAIETWLNVYRLTQDSFKDIADYANESAKGLDNLARAYREAGKAASDFQSNPPKRDRDLVSNAGIDFYGLKINLDTLYRQPLDWIFEKFGGQFTTQGTREFNDFRVNASDLMNRSNQNFTESLNAKNIIPQIQELDQQLETIRSQRFDLLPGDREGLAKSIEEEQALLKEREKLLKITSAISTNFARDIENIKKTLEAIERLPEGADTAQIRADLEGTLAALQLSSSNFDQMISAISRGISESDRRLRNLTEGMSQFNDALEKMAALARARTIQNGLNGGLTRTQIDRQLQELSLWESEQKLSQLNKSIAQIKQDLKSPINAQTIQNLGINPETVGSAQLERMLGEGRSPQEQSTLRTIQKLKQLQQEAANAEYQMAQAQQGLIEAQNNYFLQLFNFWLQLKRSFEDLSVQTSDTLEELRRQFVSVVQSIKQTQNQAAFTSLKAILTQPLVTQAERLINATNDAFEQYLNSLTQEIEQAFSRAALDFNLEQQLEGINNAITDANRQQRDRARQATRQQEDTTRQWWDIRRQSPFVPSIASIGANGTTTPNSGAATPNSGAATPNNGTTTPNNGSPYGTAQGVSGETILNPLVPEGLIRQSEQNVGIGVTENLPTATQQSIAATQQATENTTQALEEQKTAVTQLTQAQRALGEVEARLSAQQRRNNLIRYLQDTGYAAESLSNQIDDLEDKYSETSPQRQHEAAMRSIKQEYLGLGRQTRNQLNTLIQQRDRFQELTQILNEQGIPGLQAYQQQLLQAGNTTGAEQIQKIIDAVSEDASFLERQLPRIQELIDKYQQELGSLESVYNLARDRQELLNYFNQRSFQLEKDKTLNQLDNQLREAQAGLLGNTYGRKSEAADLERKKALTETSDRYEQQKLELQRDIMLNPSKYSKDQIERMFSALEQWFDATVEQIDRQYQVRIDFDQREFGLQRSRGINDIQGQLLGSQGQFLQNRGDEFGSANLLQRQAEIQENDRYQQQLFDLEKDAAINPTKYTVGELEQLKAKLLEINQINLQNIDNQFKDLGETITSVAKDALEGFFTDIFTNTKSVGDAFRDMAVAILKSIAQIAAKQVVLTIFKAAAGASGVPAFATGGAVEGPGTGTSDSILARLSNGEFVMRASAVKHWGEDFLSDLNSMRSPRLSFATSEGRGGNSNRVSNPTLVFNVSTPDANSFRRSESQLGRDAGEMYRRSLYRNS